MNEQMSLFCNNECDHNFSLISHSCEIEKINNGDYTWDYIATSVVVVRCKTCGLEEERKETAYEDYIL